MVVDKKMTQAMAKSASQALSNNYEMIAQDPLKHVITVMEKKVRNMDKRKVKLDGYRKLVSQGATLDPDQQAAVNKYSEVVGSLDFAKELIKGFSGVSVEVDKAQRKSQVQEQSLKKEKNLKRSQFVAKSPVIFNLVFSQERVQQDFLQGRNNAVQLEQDALDLLLKFHESCLICEPGTGDNVLEKAEKIGKHLNSLYDGTSEKICNTTYSEIKIIFASICECGYFENLPDFEDQVENTEPDEVLENESTSSLEEEQENDFEEEEKLAKTGIEFSAHSSEQHTPDDEVDNKEEVVEEAAPAYTPQEFSGKFNELSDPEVSNNLEFVDASVSAAKTNDPMLQQSEQMSFMSFQFEDPASVAVPKADSKNSRTTHTIEELLSDVQGEYNFLQESMLDSEDAAMRSGISYSGQGIHSNFPVESTSSTAGDNIQPSPFTSVNDSTEKDTSYLKSGPKLTANDIVGQLHTPNNPTNSLYYVEQDKSEAFAGSKLTQGPESQVQQSADNLGMGQTTFGSGEQTYNIDVPTPSSQYSGSLRSIDSFQSQQVDLNMRKGVPDSNAYSTSPFSSLHGNSQPPFEGNSIPDPIPLPSSAPIVAQSLTTPDPPSTGIPFPNDKMSGYHSYTTPPPSMSTTTAAHLSQSQEDSSSQLSALPESQPQSSLLSGGDAEHLTTSAMKQEQPAPDSIGSDNAMQSESKEDLSSNGRVTGNKNAPQVSGASMNRNNRGNSVGYPNSAQQNHYNRGNVMSRQQGQGMGGFYQNRGGNYRPSHNRSYGNFDSMGHPKHFGGSGGGFQHPQGGGGMAPFNAPYNRQDNNMYGGGMQRRGGGGPARGNRGYQGRMNMRISGSNNNYNRSRTFRTPNSEQTA